MAGGGIVVTGPAKNYAGRLTPTVIISCIVAATGGLIFGYDLGITGGVTSMDVFLIRFFPSVYHKMRKAKTNNYCKFDSQLLTLFTSSLFISGLIASILASPVTRTRGRKTSILIGGASFLTGAALNGAAVNVTMLILGRIMLGIGVGFANQAVPLYLSEMAPAKMRGALNVGFPVFVSVGVLVANLINYGTAKLGGWGWRLSLALAAVPAAILTVGSMCLPDSPNSLVERGHFEKARAMLERIRGTSDVQDELDDMIKASEACKLVKHPFRNIVRRKYRPQLVMALLIPFFQQCTGINVITFYAPVLFRTIGFGHNSSLMSAVIIGSIGLVGTCMTIFIVDTYGRRPLLLEGGFQMGISQVIVAIILAVQLGSSGEGHFSKGNSYFVITLICTYVTAFNWSWGPLGWLIPSEIFPLEIRSAGQSITVSVNFLFTFILGQTFLSILCHFKFGIFLFFGGWMAIMSAFAYFFIPETKNVPIEEMSRVWSEHWFWKRFASQDESELRDIKQQIHL